MLPKEEVLSYKIGGKNVNLGEGNEALSPQVHSKSIMSLTKTHAKKIHPPACNVLHPLWSSSQSSSGLTWKGRAGNVALLTLFSHFHFPVFPLPFPVSVMCFTATLNKGYSVDEKKKKDCANTSEKIKSGFS